MTLGGTLYHASHTRFIPFYTAFGYQSLSSLNSKCSLQESCLANSLVILEWVFFYILEMFSTFRVMAWREIIVKAIFLLWEQNAFTCYFNIMNNITWYFVLPMLPFTFLRRNCPLLLMARQTCILTGSFAVAWIHLAWYFSFYLRQTWQRRRLLWLWNTG